MATDWAALRERYGKGKGAALVRRAIAAELPGGADLLQAQALANNSPLRPSPDQLAAILGPLQAAIDAAPAAPCAKPLGQAAAFLRQAASPHGSASESVPMAAALARLAAAREFAAAEILARYPAADRPAL